MTSTKNVVRTAVIPAAGLGTRFLPGDQGSCPRRCSPSSTDQPIQWVVEEAVAAGIDDIVIITSPHKKSLEDHFDRMAELETILEAKGKTDMLETVRRITDLATFHFTRQGAPLGLGHAVSMAARHVRDEPFAVLLPDELLPDGGATLRRMIESERDRPARRSSRWSRSTGPRSRTTGVPGFSDRDGDVITIDRIVEKPAYEDAPSNLRVTGRYVFTPDIFDKLAETEPGRGRRDPAHRRDGHAHRRPRSARSGDRRRRLRRRSEGSTGCAPTSSSALRSDDGSDGRWRAMLRARGLGD